MTKKTDNKTRASKGGVARREALSAEQRKDVAKKAAEDRWAKAKGLPKETHSGVLQLGPGIPCSVLDNHMRVFSVNGLTRAFGSGQHGRVASDHDGLLPPFLAAANLRPFISSDLMPALGEPIEYRAKQGGRIALGYEATLLTKICNALLDARAAGVLRKPQLPVAAAAELLMRGFAEVGLVALIDEATGYQAERARDELHKILEAYISRELLPWTKRFPDEFFEQIYRVHGWRYEPGNQARPGYVGHFINRFVYEQLPEGVLTELRRRNPPVEGRRRRKHFQFLTKHTGNPHLDKQIVAVSTILRLADSKQDFETKFLRVYPPRSGTQTELNLDSPAPVDPALMPEVLADVTSSPSHVAMSLLVGGNTVPTKDIARAVYKDTSEATMGKARHLLMRMRDRGLVESPSPGLWRKASSPA